MMNEMEYRTIGKALAGGYRAAVYCRLSKDDDLQGESASIANQRDMLEKYCEKQGWEVVAVYQDDGFLKITMHDVAYKTALVRSIGYKQTEGVSYSDVEWNFTPLVAVRTMRYMPVPLYRYTLDRLGQTVADGVEDRHFCDNVTVMKSMVEHYARRGNIPTHIEWLTERLLARRAKFVYRRCLLRLADTTEPALALLDKQVQALTPTLSHYLDHMRLSMPLLPMHYIRLWRRNPNDWRYRLGVTMYHWLH